MNPSGLTLSPWGWVWTNWAKQQKYVVKFWLNDLNALFVSSYRYLWYLSCKIELRPCTEAAATSLYGSFLPKKWACHAMPYGKKWKAQSLENPRTSLTLMRAAPPFTASITGTSKLYFKNWLLALTVQTLRGTCPSPMHALALLLLFCCWWPWVPPLNSTWNPRAIYSDRIYNLSRCNFTKLHNMNIY